MLLALIFVIIVAIVIIAICSRKIETFTANTKTQTKMINAHKIPNRLQIYLDTIKNNKWGFIPQSETLTGNSQTATYGDIYAYWNPNYDYTDYWNYSYPYLVYPNHSYSNHNTFGHSTYSNLFQLARGIPVSNRSVYL